MTSGFFFDNENLILQPFSFSIEILTTTGLLQGALQIDIVEQVSVTVRRT